MGKIILTNQHLINQFLEFREGIQMYEEIFICQECDLVFDMKTKLRGHEKKMHPELYTYGDEENKKLESLRDGFSALGMKRNYF